MTTEVSPHTGEVEAIRPLPETRTRLEQIYAKAIPQVRGLMVNQAMKTLTETGYAEVPHAWFRPMEQPGDYERLGKRSEDKDSRAAPTGR